MFAKQLNIQPRVYSTSERYLQLEIVCVEFKGIEMDFGCD
jgi:hypothetical protein